MPNVDSELVLFNDGEGVTHGDLNDIGNALTQRAWEWPGYIDLLAHNAQSGQPFNTEHGNAANLDRLVLCKGVSGAVSAAGLVASIGSGFLGIYAGASVPPAVLDPKMRWIHVNGAHDVTLTAAPGGQKRYDAILLAVDQLDDTPTARDFEDAVTGALSTANPNKRRRLRPTFSVVSGAADASPTPPSPTAGQRVVALVLVNSTAIETIHDCTIPAGPPCTHMTFPQESVILSGLSTNWVHLTGGAAKATNGTNSLVAVPRMFGGDPTARLLGVAIYAGPWTSGQTVKVGYVQPGDITFYELADISSLINTGIAQWSYVGLAGYPLNVAATRGPFWGHGGRVKRSQYFQGVEEGRTIAVQFHGGAVDDQVMAIKWVFAKG